MSCNLFLFFKNRQTDGIGNCLFNISHINLTGGENMLSISITSNIDITNCILILLIFKKTAIRR